MSTRTEEIKKIIELYKLSDRERIHKLNVLIANDKKKRTNFGCFIKNLDTKNDRDDYINYHPYKEHPHWYNSVDDVIQYLDFEYTDEDEIYFDLIGELTDYWFDNDKLESIIEYSEYSRSELELEVARETIDLRYIDINFSYAIGTLEELKKEVASELMHSEKYSAMKEQEIIAMLEKEKQLKTYFDWKEYMLNLSEIEYFETDEEFFEFFAYSGFYDDCSDEELIELIIYHKRDICNL